MKFALVALVCAMFMTAPAAALRVINAPDDATEVSAEIGFGAFTENVPKEFCSNIAWERLAIFIKNDSLIDATPEREAREMFWFQRFRNAIQTISYTWTEEDQGATAEDLFEKAVTEKLNDSEAEMVDWRMVRRPNQFDVYVFRVLTIGAKEGLLAPCSN